MALCWVPASKVARFLRSGCDSARMSCCFCAPMAGLISQSVWARAVFPGDLVRALRLPDHLNFLEAFMQRQTLAFHPWCILSAMLVAVMPCAPAAAQQPNNDLRAVQRVHQRVAELRERADIWPGFRPDTLPYLFVLPGRGHALVNWHGQLPEGFLAVDGLPRLGFRALDALRAASTSTE